MRDFLVIGVVLASLPIGLFRPFYGLLVYAWISYMNPHMLAWSFAQTFPVAKLSSLSVLAGIFLSGQFNLKPLHQRELKLMLLVWGTFSVSTVFAFYFNDAWTAWKEVSKVLLM